MKNLELIRLYLPDGTIVMKQIDQLTLATFERPWNDNKSDISCIPEGRYTMHMDNHGRHMCNGEANQ